MVHFEFAAVTKGGMRLAGERTWRTRLEGLIRAMFGVQGFCLTSAAAQHMRHFVCMQTTGAAK